MHHTYRRYTYTSYIRLCIHTYTSYVRLFIYIYIYIYINHTYDYLHIHTHHTYDYLYIHTPHMYGPHTYTHIMLSSQGTNTCMQITQTHAHMHTAWPLCTGARWMHIRAGKAAKPHQGIVSKSQGEVINRNKNSQAFLCMFLISHVCIPMCVIHRNIYQMRVRVHNLLPYSRLDCICYRIVDLIASVTV
jgi:hypothetical protein